MQDDAPATPGRRAVPWWLIGAGVVGVIAWFVLRGLVAPLTYFQDEWVFIGERREFGLDLVLAPHNEHPAVIPAIVYWLVFQIRGLAGFGVLAAILVATHVATAGMLLILLRRWVPTALAAVAAACLLTFGWSDEVLLWPFSIGFMLSVLTGLIAMVAWDTPTPSAGRDAVGSIAMVLGLASAAAAVVYLGVATLILLSHRPPLRRLVWVALPVVLFGIWYVTYGRVGAEQGGAPPDLILLPSFIATGLTTLAAPLIGMDHRFAPAAVVGIALVGGAAVGWTRLRTMRFWAPIAGIVACLGIIGLGRLGDYGVTGAMAPRYLYLTGTLALIAGAVLVDAVYRSLHGRARTVLAAGVAVWLVIVVAGGMGKLVRSAEVWRDRADVTRAELAALQVWRSSIEGTPAAREPIGPPATGGMTPRGYYEAMDDLSPVVAASAESIRALPQELRLEVDTMLDRLLGSTLGPVASGPPAPGGAVIEPTLRETRDVELVGDGGSCVTGTVTGPDPSVVVAPGSAPGVAIRTDGQRTLEVFGLVLADDFGPHLRRGFPATPDQWYEVRPQSLGDRFGWRLRIDPPPGSSRFDLCLLADD
jgi:hypothetical protein